MPRTNAKSGGEVAVRGYTLFVATRADLLACIGDGETDGCSRERVMEKRTAHGMTRRTKVHVTR
ncbi:MAG: hypothetical protein HQM03_18920 [Magnetococcales bacterium]|nr:hypothetical protein [Magnetococcales bacterium]